MACLIRKKGITTMSETEKVEIKRRRKQRQRKRFSDGVFRAYVVEADDNTSLFDARGFTDFIHNFQMTRVTFMYICKRLFLTLSGQDTSLVAHIGEETCWRWAVLAGNRCLLPRIANLFGIVTVCSIVHEFCRAVRHVLMPEDIKLLQVDDLQEVSEGFRQRWGFPQCRRAVDGSHIPIIAPEENHTDCFNCKGWHWVVLHGGIFDHFKMTVVHNIYLTFSPFWFSHTSTRILPLKIIMGVQVPIMLLSDSAYPLQNWLEHHSRTRKTVEYAFGWLKAQWRCLGRRLDVAVPTIIAAGCTLHYVCLMHGEADKESGGAVPRVERRAEADVQPTRVNSLVANVEPQMNVLFLVFLRLTVTTAAISIYKIKCSIQLFGFP
uniref:DDE Tnp4 domain-containing protein n=1 Tax=Stegastes partitus TaxID=144197 RepID=A0A3B5B0G1_9TELE